MILTKEDKTHFEAATECWLCKKSFVDSDKKVRDHCHYSVNSEEQLIINVTCFSENRNMFR